MPAHARIAVVTGANKGIGYAIVRNLALQYPTSPLNNGPLLIYLGSRSQSRGDEALQSLLSDRSISQNLSSAGGPVDIHPASIDISSSSSIASIAAQLREKHPDGIDILINNAGIAMSGFNSEVVEKTLETNYFGTLEMIRTFLPLLKNSATSRLVNVSSMSGHLTAKYSDATAARFRNAKTVDDVTALMNEYTELVKQGKEKEAGFISAGYATSKAGVTGMTRTLAWEQKASGSPVLINCCCPGYVATDMTGGAHGGAGTTPDEGAQLPVKLAIQDIGGVTGEYWKDGKIRQW